MASSNLFQQFLAITDAYQSAASKDEPVFLNVDQLTFSQRIPFSEDEMQVMTTPLGRAQRVKKRSLPA